MSKRTTICPFVIQRFNTELDRWVVTSYEKTEKRAKKSLNNLKRFNNTMLFRIASNPNFNGEQ